MFLPNAFNIRIGAVEMDDIESVVLLDLVKNGDQTTTNGKII